MRAGLLAGARQDSLRARLTVSLLQGVAPRAERGLLWAQKSRRPARAQAGVTFELHPFLRPVRDCRRTEEKLPELFELFS